MLPPVRSDRSSTWIAGSSPVMTGGGVAPAVHPALYIEEHGLPAALHVNVEAVDGDAVALFTCSDQRLTALCRHREQHRIARSEEHTSELQSLMRISYAVFCLKKKKTQQTKNITIYYTQNKIEHNKTIANTNTDNKT